MQNMLSDWKICLKIINISTYDQSLSNLRKVSENAQFTTCTNDLFWCQQITKTISRYNTDSFGPVCQLWFVTLSCMRDSKPQRCVQQPESLKMRHMATNRKKHINEALKQTFANNLFKISSKYVQSILSNWKICLNVIKIRTYAYFFVTWIKL